MTYTYSVRLQRGLTIPMRDGVQLSARLFLPARQSCPSPVLVTLTPYIADSCHSTGMWFASHGWPFVAVDVRGRGDSEGEFRPLIQEADDGYDVVEWLARQPYCNGKVAMWGGSYLGYAQWATARTFPPHLATIVPMASAYPGVDFPMRRNIFPTFVAQWLAATRGRALQARIVHDRAFWSDVFRTWFESGKPFRQLANLFGSECAVLQEWLSHPEPDAYWDAHNPSPEQCGRMQIPILTITGIYDDDQPGALEHYRQHMLHASPSARAQHYLIIGPWDHAGSAGTPRAEFGGLKVGDAALIDFLQLHHEWYAWTMQGGPKPRFLEKAVAYYVTGSERWRYADSLEAITASHQTYFLDSSGAANDVFASGSLGTARATGLPDHYLYDPRDSGAPEIRVEADADESSLIDQATTLALSGRQLVYHSAPFEEDTEVGGFFRLCAWIAIDCPDTDFHVSVHEIDPRGASLRLSTTALRARYREGVRTPKRIDTAAPLRYDFEGFTFVARTVRRSHRLRLIIAPIGRPIETKFAQKNYNAGGVVADESAVDGRAVRVALYHDAEHPSALYVPLTSSHTAARSHRSSVV